ncbi:hypothetical protein [Streptomyces sp. NBC_01518]|uniref:hypothetical protein n=1 Tax=Streptomyces sp. NBC_01518 TaxID=2903891 RepID=UPI00386F25B2
MTTLAEHLAQVDSLVLGAEIDIPEFERQIAEAERNLPNALRQHQAATANVRALLGSGPDSVPFLSEIDRQAAALLAAIEMRGTKTNLRTCQQTIDTLKAKLANRRTDLLQAQALRQRVQLAMQTVELPTFEDELEALMEGR